MGVSAARVSQWLAEGKINGDAIDGEGRSARIRPDVARRQLRERLDVSQRFGLNGIGTRLDDPARSSPAPVEASPPPLPLAPLAAPQAPSAPAEDTVEAKIKQEKLFQVQLQTEKQLEDRRLARGYYIRAEDARKEAVQIAAKLLAAFEGSLTDLAAALAAKFEVPNRDVLHLVRSEFRNLRSRIAEQYAAEAAIEPDAIDDDRVYDEPLRQ